MNGRIHDEDTPEARLAAVARSLMLQMREVYKTGVPGKRHPYTGAQEPDYADFREAFKPFLQRELLKARIDEARQSHSNVINARVAELARELETLYKTMPSEFRL